MKRLRQNQSGILYILITIGLFLFIVGFAFFAAWAVMFPVAESMTPIAESNFDDSWPLWNIFQSALSFMTSFWNYVLLALAVFGLIFWVLMESQHRGRPY